MQYRGCVCSLTRTDITSQERKLQGFRYHTDLLFMPYQIGVHTPIEDWARRGSRSRPFRLVDKLRSARNPRSCCYTSSWTQGHDLPPSLSMPQRRNTNLAAFLIGLYILTLEPCLPDDPDRLTKINASQDRRAIVSTIVSLLKS